MRLVPQVGHAFWVDSVTFSPDGKTLASGSSDTSIRLWDVRTGKVLRTLAGHTGSVYSVDFSPDGKKIVSGSQDASIQVWDVNSGKALRTLTGYAAPVYSVAFSPDGKTVAGGSRDKTNRLWDVDNGRVLRTLTGQTDLIYSVAFSPDGKTLASASQDKTIRLWDIKTRQVLASLTGHTSYVTSVAFSPDGKTLVSASGDKTIRLWDATTGTEVRTFTGHIDGVNSVVFSPDGKTIASASRDKTIRLWNAATGKPVRTFMGHVDSIGSVAFSPDGKTLASGSVDKTIRLWDVVSGRELRVLTGYTNDVYPLALFPDGKTLASASGDDRIQLLDATSGKVLQSLTGRTNQAGLVAVSPDGKTLASESVNVGMRLRDASTGTEISSLSSNKDFDIHIGSLETVAFSPDGKTLATGSIQDTTIRLWDVITGKDCGSFTGHTWWVRSISFSPNGKLLGSGSDDCTVRMWDVTTGKQLRSFAGHKAPVYSVAFSSDSKTLASGGQEDDTIRIWDVETGKELKPLIGHRGWVETLAFSPHGKTIASGGTDSTIRLWDAAFGKELKVLRGHNDRVIKVTFSPDGNTLLSGSRDTTMRLWDVVSGTELCTLLFFTDGTRAVTTPDGRFDIETFEGSVPLIWVASDAPLTPLPIEIFTRDYYEPGLLAKAFRREKLNPVKPITALNRAQPTVRIASDLKGDSAVITVTAGIGTAAIEREGKKVDQIGNPQDLRIFVDGKLAAYEDGPLSLTPDGKWTKSFDIPMPHNGETRVEISAYCFNQDRVKSETVTQTVKLDLPKRQGRAYVISVGVDLSTRADLRLKYAAADAVALSDGLQKRLEGFSEVVSIPLVSKGDVHNATKVKFRAVIDALAGRKADLTGIQNAEKLKKSTSEDLIIISWSGHGVSSKSGMFYLLPEDVKTVSDTFSSEFLASCISSDELSTWLRDVVAGDMALIIDACHSAAAVQSEDFKPGPLGNRGLGQLAYDKGIRVLAATQAADVALESDKIGNGLLTYALVHDGLDLKLATKTGKAPTLKEWLTFAAERVPELYQDIASGKLQVARGPRADPINEIASPNQAFIQKPALFDYTRRPSPVPFVKL